MYQFRINHNNFQSTKLSLWIFHMVILQLVMLLLLNILELHKMKPMAVEISPQQFGICQEANGQFCTIPTPFQLLANLPSCIAALYAKNTASIPMQDVHYRLEKASDVSMLSQTCTQCLDFNHSTFSSNHHNYPHMPWRNNTDH